jgi:general stress protein YciG
MITAKNRYKLTPEKAREVGRLGGIARAKALSKEQRQEIAKKATHARWKTLWRM